MERICSVDHKHLVYLPCRAYAPDTLELGTYVLLLHPLTLLVPRPQPLVSHQQVSSKPPSPSFTDHIGCSSPSGASTFIPMPRLLCTLIQVSRPVVIVHSRSSFYLGRGVDRGLRRRYAMASKPKPTVSISLCEDRDIAHCFRVMGKSFGNGNEAASPFVNMYFPRHG